MATGPNKRLKRTLVNSRRLPIALAQNMLLLLVLACIGYLFYVAASILRQKAAAASAEDDALRSALKSIIAGGVPVVVAATMTYLFLIVGGATTVQFNTGSPSRMNAWSTWVDLWPVFLLLTAVSGFGSLIWLVVCAANKSMRPTIATPIFSLLLSVLAFFTVFSYFPSA